jgi:malonyl-CoA O-methyltransferase
VSRIRQAYEHYRQDGLLPATYEVVYGHAWKLDADRQRTGEVQVDITGLPK